MSDPNNKSLSIKKGTDIKDSVNPDYKLKKTGLKSKDQYISGIRNGDRTILSQAITLIESSREDFRNLGQDILDECLEYTGESLRIGITGVPGVGKSTFIEVMGQFLIEQDKKLAVLTIDPSSSRSGGSILGDKTRMNTLSNHENAYIRPSPASGKLGGVARKTRESLLLCEAAGYDTIFIETVGVGQSETAVHSMVDFFLLLMIPGAGDELQGIKRGIVEMADMIAINKADGENIRAAERARSEFKNALSLFPASPSKWEPPVLTCSALQKSGIDTIWEEIMKYQQLTVDNGYFDERRKEQAAYWMYETIHQQLKEKFYKHPAVKDKLKETEHKVQQGKISSYKAANLLLQLFESK